MKFRFIFSGKSFSVQLIEVLAVRPRGIASQVYSLKATMTCPVEPMVGYEHSNIDELQFMSTCCRVVVNCTHTTVNLGKTQNLHLNYIPIDAYRRGHNINSWYMELG